MSATTIKIALHGLIALVLTTEPGGVQRMTALLLDARMPHDMECVSAHFPKLKLLAKEPRECLQVGCRISGNECTCEAEDLERKNIWFDIHPSPQLATTRFDNDPPINTIPTSAVEAANFSYVANLSQMPFGLAVKQTYLEPSPPQNLAVRMLVPFTKATACSLSVRPDAGVSNVHSMSFRRLNDPSSGTESSQALAQRVITELTIPEATPPEEQKVILHISDFDGGSDRAIELLATNKGYRIDFSNQPTAPLKRDDPCNDGISRHFAMYYELADQAVAEADRLIPHVRFTPGTSALSIEPDACKDRFFGLIDRPICPVASFNP